MTKKQYQAFATPPKPNGGQTDPAVYAATYWRSALRMATLRALVVISGVAAIGAAAGAIALFEQLPLAAAALGVLALVIGVFAISLNNHTTAVAKATWNQLENALDEDLDDDGYIGDPTRNVRVGGNKPTDIMLDLPAASVSRAPILRPFGVSAPDLISFLFEAKHSRGLQERQWIGKGIRMHMLPSGQSVTSTMFRQLLVEIAKVGWAVKTAGRWELTVEPEDVAKRLQTQLQPAEPQPSRRSKAAISQRQP